MSTPSLPSSVLSIGSTIGRYFSVVSMVPALFLVLWVYALFASCAWSGRPNLHALVHQLGAWSAGKVAWLVIAVLLMALLLNPLQFATIQLLEGYWGSSRAGVALAAARIRIYRNRKRRLSALAGDADGRLLAASGLESDNTEQRSPEDLDDFLASRAADGVMGDLVARDAAEKALKSYPDGDRIMPTRLGNVLRYYEDSAGDQYGLDSVTVAPHFALVAPERHVQYLDDAREQMDTAVQLCSVFLLATAATFGLLVTDGLWLLVALIPYTLAYVAYRAAVSAAEEYGTALSTILDLDRRLFYDQMGVDQPAHTGDEQALNQRLMERLRDHKPVWVRYARREPPPATPGQ